MPDPGFFAVFLIGLLGGTHCVGMCGGIVGALSLRAPGAAPAWRLHLAYNAGRIASYSAAGALLGGLGGLGLLLDDLMPVQLALYVAANLMLLALGLHLTGTTRVLAPVERAGHALWRRLQPLSARFLPACTPGQALPLGLLWGFLPCGMVYAVLATALVSGSAVRGAGPMLAFGLGTLPNLLLAGAAAARLRDLARRRWLRTVAGLVVCGFGIAGLVHAFGMTGRLLQGAA